MIWPIFSRSKTATSSSIGEAITRLNAEPTTENRRALYLALKTGRLFIAAQNIPEAWTHGAVTLEQATTISVVTSSSEGGEALLAFTSHDEALRRNPSISTFAMGALDVLHLVVAEGLSALVVNPAGPWASISAVDIQSILGESK